MFDEIQVFDGIAERTGMTVDSAGVRGRAAVCRSLRDLGAKCRRLGDGYYYLLSSAWPEGVKSVSLVQTWAPMS